MRNRLGRFAVWGRHFVLTLSVAAATLGLIMAISARLGIETEFDSVVGSIGRNLLRVAQQTSVRCEDTADKRLGFSLEDVDSLRALPSILAVSGSTAHLSPSNSIGRYAFGYVGVTSNYLDVLNIPLQSGRSFADGETGVAVLGAALADALFESDPVGMILDDGRNSFTIIGVLAPIADERSYASSELSATALISMADFEAMFDRTPMSRSTVCNYLPFSMLWVRVNPDETEEAIASILNVVGARGDIKTLTALYALVFQRRGWIVSLYEAASLVLLFLSAVNMLALGMAVVSHEAKAVGIRRALGASHATITAHVIRRFGMDALIGLLIGTGVYCLLAPELETLLGVPLRLGARHIAGLGVLVGVLAMAAAAPTHQASRVTPVQAIRQFESQEHRLCGKLNILVLFAATVGIASVLFVATFADALRGAVEETFGAVDPNVFSVSSRTPESEQYLPPFNMTREDLETIRGIAGVFAVSGEILEETAVRTEFVQLQSRVRWVMSLGPPFVAGDLMKGRLPTRSEFESAAHVALVERSIAERLFDDSSPLGERIIIHDEPYEVIGVVQSFGEGQTATADEGIFAVAGSFWNWHPFHQIWVKLDPVTAPAKTIGDIRDSLKRLHPGYADPLIEGPAVEMGTIIGAINSTVVGLYRLALLALLVGSLGLGSLFWTRVSQRRHEFGIRRTLGASSMRILWSVFRVALMLTLISGAMGLAASLIGIDMLGSWLLRARIAMVSTTFKPEWLLWAILVSFAAACVGSGIPALSAALSSPAECLRVGRRT